MTLNANIRRVNQCRTLKLDDGSVSHDEIVIISEIIKYYKQLYSVVDVDLHKMDSFFNGLSLLSGQSILLFDKPVTLLELYDVLLCMKSDKVPGIDGLSSNFYKTFWNIVCQDL